MSKHFKKVLLALIILVLVPLWVPIVLDAAGFYVNIPGWKIAETAAEKHDVRICKKIWIMPWREIFSPSSFDQMETCIHEYARITKDPTICNLLMPSEYGLACISNLWLQAAPGEGCGWNVKDDTIYECRHGNDELLLQSKNCKTFAKNPKQFSACIESFAERNHDLEQCKEIPDQFIRTFCETKIEAWFKYPQLRHSFYFGTLLPLEKATQL